MFVVYTAFGNGPVQIAIGIGFCGNKLEKVRFGGAGNVFGNALCIAGSGEIDNQYFAGLRLRFALGFF